jgi:hypothetical protein
LHILLKSSAQTCLLLHNHKARRITRNKKKKGQYVLMRKVFGETSSTSQEAEAALRAFKNGISYSIILCITHARQHIPVYNVFAR